MILYRAHDKCSDFPIFARSQRPVSTDERERDVAVVAPCDKPALSEDLSKLTDLQLGRQTRFEEIVRAHAAIQLQQISPVFHPAADRDAVVVKRASIQELCMKLEGLITDADLNIGALRNLRSSGRFVLLDRLAVGFIACTEVEAQVQPIGGMEQLVKVE